MRKRSVAARADTAISLDIVKQVVKFGTIKVGIDFSKIGRILNMGRHKRMPQASGTEASKAKAELALVERK
jgi:hypothetical protein